MRTKKRLIELSNTNESWIYKDIARTLSRRLFISKIQIKAIRNIEYFRYDLYEEILENFTTLEYFFIHLDEIIKQIENEFWWLNRFCLSCDNWRLDAITFVLSYNFDKIIKDI